MSVEIRLPDESPIVWEDHSDDLDNRVTYWYELHPSGAILVHKDIAGPTGTVNLVDIVYGPGQWQSVSGETGPDI